MRGLRVLPAMLIALAMLGCDTENPLGIAGTTVFTLTRVGGEPPPMAIDATFGTNGCTAEQTRSVVVIGGTLSLDETGQYVLAVAMNEVCETEGEDPTTRSFVLQEQGSYIVADNDIEFFDSAEATEPVYSATAAGATILLTYGSSMQLRFQRL